MKRWLTSPVRLTRRGLALGSLLVLAAAGVALLGPRLWQALFFDEHEPYLQLVERPHTAQESLKTIRERWQPDHAIQLLETLILVRNPEVRQQGFAVLGEQTGQSFGDDHRQWFEWIWNTQPAPPSRYATFKAALYGKQVDQTLGEYFAHDPPSAIRLDEVVWGGVVRDGIPPLRNPKVIPATAADYLEADNQVFGVEVNGEARAYPRRILIHHELVTDAIAGEPVTGAYCTLCNSMVFYKSIAGGRQHLLGTSGFLYRSNKLMYDQATKSLWSTLLGKPVVGPLVNEAIVLEPLPVVTTTWAEWRRLHPQTKVLSLDTGIAYTDEQDPPDYSEAASYGPYYASDKLVFHVPKLDARLKNKDEVFVIRTPGADAAPVAFTVRFLAEHPVHHATVGGQVVVILTDGSGANRAFETGGRTFTAVPGRAEVIDEKGATWQVRESGLTNDAGTVLQRVPGHRAFWFGWYAAHPETQLVP